VEVKATGLGKFFPCYVTAREVRCSEDVGGRPQLFRVFDSGRAPSAYVLAGPLRGRCHLGPTLFRATIRGQRGCVGVGGPPGATRWPPAAVRCGPGGLPGCCLPGFPLVRAPPSC
jgi:hypothetical protein